MLQGIALLVCVCIASWQASYGISGCIIASPPYNQDLFPSCPSNTSILPPAQVFCSLATRYQLLESAINPLKNHFPNVLLLHTRYEAPDSRVVTPTPISGKAQGVRDSRADGVGDWLLCAETFSTWDNPANKVAKPVLLCHGGPGVGKTFISSLVIDTLGSKIGLYDKVIAYVYCDFRAQNEQSVSSVLSSVLNRALGRIPSISGKLNCAFEMVEKHVEGFKLRLHEILKRLIESISP
ncbi:hypothetical protein HOY80DRAFT_702868 [Tuber brumale]|nr:hypothetical protein HOY80DRAFT_702868 [Tuber brumale]